MTKALLLDLDNTLILYNEPAFLQQYFAKLATAFGDLIPPDNLSERILLSTMALSSNDGFLNNSDYFMNTFLDPGADRRQVWDRFLTFYQTGYRELLPACSPPDGFDDVFTDLRAKDVKLVLATNPIYPLAAYEHRLSWVGLAPSDFDHVTHIENVGFVKPNPGYFRQICETIQIAPQSCLMVGNDPVYDIAACAIGIRTYLTTDAPESDFHLPGIASDKSLAHTPDHTGPFSAVTEVLGL
jgi:FMN phosphatase YigB (HAD superfamily)